MVRLLVKVFGWTALFRMAIWLSAHSISNYLEDKFMDAAFNATSFGLAGDPYISLHTADPGETGASEVVGGSYARQQAAFGASSGGAVANSGNIDFASMPAVTVTHVGVWDALTNGNFLWGGALSGSQAVGAGATFRIPTGDLDVSID